MPYYLYLGYWKCAPIIKPGITSRPLGHRKKDHSHPIPGFNYWSAYKIDCSKTMIIKIEQQVLIRTKQYIMEGFPLHEIRIGTIPELYDIDKIIQTAIAEEEFNIAPCYDYDLLSLQDVKDEIPLDFEPFSSANVSKEKLTELLENCTIEEFKEISLEEVKLTKNEIQLKGWQNEAFDIINNFESQKMHFEVFCGGGKTIIYQKVFETLVPYWDCFILIVPGITLMSDMKNRWHSLIKQKAWDSIYVSSENTYATTNVERIKTTIQKSKKIFICVTIQSFKRVELALQTFKNIYIVGDEAHHLCGDKEYSPLAWLNESSDRQINIKKMLFATATPKVCSYELIRKNCIYMNNVNYFGTKLEFTGGPANLRRLRREGFLCPYEVIIGEVNPDDLERVNESLTQEQSNQHLNYQASAKLLRNLIIQNPNAHKKILMYTTSIGENGSNKLGVRDLIKIVTLEFATADLQKVGIFYADSRRSQVENDKAIASFEDKNNIYKITILINCRMYTEGINIPSLDSVVFCDPKQSISEIIQIFGRPLRNDSANPQKIASIIVPVLTNLEISNQLQYQKILDIIRTISTQDEFLRDEIFLSSFQKDEEKEPEKEGVNNQKPILRTVFIDKENIEFKTNLKLFDFLQTQIQKDCASLEEAILITLGDNIPRTVWQILEEIHSHGFWADADIKNCTQCCQEMLQSRKLSEIDGMYFLEIANYKMSINEFISSLVEKNIFTEATYREVFGAQDYPENYPASPARIYPNLWDKLITHSKNTYSRDECSEIFKQKSKAIKALLAGAYKTDDEKNIILNTWDNRIPPDLKRTYNINNLSELNEECFRVSRR